MKNIIIKSAFQIGMTASEVVIEIVRINPEISHLGFYVYKPHYNIMELQRKPLLPMLLFHNPSQETIRLKRQEIITWKLKNIIDSLKGDVIGVLSTIFEEKNEIHHLPLMDFSCSDSRANLNKTERFLKEIGQQGVILFSGKSYHYYGVNPMNEKEYSNFLGDCLLSGLVNERYIGHRLKDECGILRLSACPLQLQVPAVISILK